MQTKIRHLAMLSERPPHLQKFYQAVFGMKNGHDKPSRAALLGDGYVGMNINPGGMGKKTGLNHWGFQIDDVAEIQARLHERYPQVEVLVRPSNRPFAGVSSHDPEGNIFDLSQATSTRRSVYADEGERNPRHISHFMVPAMDAQAMGTFYKEIYELTELPKADGDPNVYLSDGQVTMIVGQWRLSNYGLGGLDGKPTIDYLGFRVESLERFLADLDQLAEDDPSLAPRRRLDEGGVPRDYQAQGPVDEEIQARLAQSALEGKNRMKVFQSLAIGQYQLADPDGVPLDVTDR